MSDGANVIGFNEHSPENGSEPVPFAHPPGDVISAAHGHKPGHSGLIEDNGSAIQRHARGAVDHYQVHGIFDGIPIMPNDIGRVPVLPERAAPRDARQYAMPVHRDAPAKGNSVGTATERFVKNGRLDYHPASKGADVAIFRGTPAELSQMQGLLRQSGVGSVIEDGRSGFGVGLRIKTDSMPAFSSLVAEHLAQTAGVSKAAGAGAGEAGKAFGRFGKLFGAASLAIGAGITGGIAFANGASAEEATDAAVNSAVPTDAIRAGRTTEATIETVENLGGLPGLIVSPVLRDAARLAGADVDRSSLMPERINLTQEQAQFYAFVDTMPTQAEPSMSPELRRLAQANGARVAAEAEMNKPDGNAPQARAKLEGAEIQLETVMEGIGADVQQKVVVELDRRAALANATARARTACLTGAEHCTQATVLIPPLTPDGTASKDQKQERS